MADRRVMTMATIEAVMVAQGHEMVCLTEDGQEILVRLSTPEEAVSKHLRACAELGVEPSITRELAEEITRPLGTS